MQFYPEIIKYHKVEKSFVKQNDTSLSIGVQSLMKTFLREINNFKHSIFFNEYRLLNLLSQTPSKHKLNGGQANYGYKDVDPEHTFYDVQIVNILPNEASSEGVEKDVKRLAEVLESSGRKGEWVGKGKTVENGGRVGCFLATAAEFFDSLPDDAAKPLYLFWVLCQCLVQRSYDLRVEETNLLEDIALKNSWKEKSPCLKKLITELKTRDEIDYALVKTGGWKIPNIKQVTEKIFKCLAAYWLVEVNSDVFF